MQLCMHIGIHHMFGNMCHSMTISMTIMNNVRINICHFIKKFQSVTVKQQSQKHNSIINTSKSNMKDINSEEKLSF